MTSYEREIGRLQADMENQQENLTRVEKKLDEHMTTSNANHKALEHKIDDGFSKFEALLHEGKGAWRVIVFVAAIAGSIVSFIGAKLLILLQIIK